MKRVHVEIEPQLLARAASSAPELSFDAVVRQALDEFAVRHLLRSHARETARRLGPRPGAAPLRAASRPAVP